MHLLRLAAKALINHEDAVNLITMDRGFVLFLGTQGNTVLPALIALSGKWNQEGGLVHGKRVPLRAILAQSFFAELKQRLTAVGSDPSRLTEQQRTALLSDGEWIMMMWCSDRAEMIADPSRPSMFLATTLQLVDSICQAVTNPETVLKFNAKPPGLTAAPKNGRITMLLEISQRFPPLIEAMRMLAGHSCLTLLNAQVKYESMMRSSSSRPFSQARVQPREGATGKGQGKGRSAAVKEAQMLAHPDPATNHHHALRLPSETVRPLTCLLGSSRSYGRKLREFQNPAAGPSATQALQSPQLLLHQRRSLLSTVGCPKHSLYLHCWFTSGPNKKVCKRFSKPLNS